MVNYQAEGLTDELPISKEWERRWLKLFAEQMYLIATGAYTSEAAVIERLQSIEVISYEQMEDYADFAGVELPDFEQITNLLAVSPVMEMLIMPHRAFTLVGLLQFALRHPELSSQLPAVANVGRDMAMNLINQLGKIHPTIADALNQGWDKRLDVTAEEFSALQNSYGSPPWQVEDDLQPLDLTWTGEDPA